MRVELHRDAHAELRDAASWYDERRAGLGTEFISAVKFVLTQIGETPQLFPPWPGMSKHIPTVRQAVIQRFPYVIAFEEHSERIVILAIAHSKRRPMYWLDRVY